MLKSEVFEKLREVKRNVLKRKAWTVLKCGLQKVLKSRVWKVLNSWVWKVLNSRELKVPQRIIQDRVRMALYGRPKRVLREVYE